MSKCKDCKFIDIRRAEPRCHYRLPRVTTDDNVITNAPRPIIHREDVSCIEFESEEVEDQFEEVRSNIPIRRYE